VLLACLRPRRPACAASGSSIGPLLRAVALLLGLISDLQLRRPGRPAFWRRPPWEGCAPRIRKRAGLQPADAPAPQPGETTGSGQIRTACKINWQPLSLPARRRDRGVPGARQSPWLFHQALASGCW